MSLGKRKLSSYSSDEDCDYLVHKKPKPVASILINGSKKLNSSCSETSSGDDVDENLKDSATIEMPLVSASPILTKKKPFQSRFRFLSDDSATEDDVADAKNNKLSNLTQLSASSSEETDDYSSLPVTDRKNSIVDAINNTSHSSNSSGDTIDYNSNDNSDLNGKEKTDLTKCNLNQLSSSSDEEPSNTKYDNESDNAGTSKALIKQRVHNCAVSKLSFAGPRSSVDPFKQGHSNNKTKVQQKSTSISNLKKKELHTNGPIIITADYDDNVDENYRKEDLLSDISDEDDEENVITDEKKRKILALFQEGSEEELPTLSKCSTKKASLLISLRPFVSWDDLLIKLDETKTLNRDLIWSCLDLLRERHTLCSLMNKCSQISKKLEAEFGRLRDTKTESPRKSSNDILVHLQPKNITTTLQLKPYQMIGLNWMALLHRHKVNGILADEMGLGKTIQTISFLAHLFDAGITEGPHLVVVPSSTLDNWIREFKTWCPSFELVLYSGSQTERRAVRQELLSGFVNCNVILTTYTIAVNAPEDRALFRKLGVYYAVFDEGHMLKNMSSQRYQHLMRITTQYRLLLTGTPLQNNLLELMSLLRFVMPHMFKETTSSLVSIFTHSNNENSGTFAKKRINHAKQIMKPFVLRRLKKDVLHQLPEKSERIDRCDMSYKQAQLYEKVKAMFKSKFTKQNMPKSELKNAFVELRKVANHPLLRREHYPDSKLRTMAKLLKNDIEYQDSNETYIFEDMQVMNDFELHKLCLTSRTIASYKLTDNVLMDSGKFNKFDEMLPKLKCEEKRILIFSQFTMMMDIIELYLKHRQHKYLRLDGTTPVSSRLNIIDQFNNDSSYFVFILSTRAGGLGINLTAANVVVLHDIDCNPYNDKQAEDRCHRVGQTKPVQVLKLISKGTIEEKMFQVAQNKLKLEKEMTESGEDNMDMASLITQSLL